MTTQAEKARDAQSKRTWLRAIIVISVVFVLGIAGVIYYGTVTLPAENKAKDVAACKTLLVGYSNAQLAFLKEENATSHKPSAEMAVKLYADKLSKGYNAAFNQIGDVNDTVGKALKQLALDRLSLDTQNQDVMATTFSTMDGDAQTADQICNGVLSAANTKGKFGSYDSSKSAVPGATPSASPSATK